MKKIIPSHRPLILITNDDGSQAKGIHELADFLTPLGDIVVVAPDGPRSGQSSAITVTTPLRMKVVEEREGFHLIRTNGTPTDCIKLSMNILLDKAPDLIVSGINHGSNAGVSVVYSGTMGAVFEGVLLGIPSIGFSLCNHSANAHFGHCRQISKHRLWFFIIHRHQQSRFGFNFCICCRPMDSGNFFVPQQFKKSEYA